MITDVVIGLSYGDEGKGKVTHHLLKSGEYTHCLRFNGGCNAGHTIYHNGKKFVTHHIPAGVFFGVKSIIGAGCVVNLEQFFSEIEMLEEGGIPTAGLIYVAENAHIITNQHLNEDGTDTNIGTTKQGNGPAYRDKYNRTGMRAQSIPALKDYLVDMYRELHGSIIEPVVLCEGAQGFGLDIDWGDYPYVTSSHCTTAGALLNGIPPALSARSMVSRRHMTLTWDQRIFTAKDASSTCCSNSAMNMVPQREERASATGLIYESLRKQLILTA